MKALELAHVEYTTDPDDEYDILHINTYFPYSYRLAKNAKKAGKKIVYHAHSTEEDFKNGFVFSKQLAPSFKKWLIKCYSLGDVIVTPTEYSKRVLDGYVIGPKVYGKTNQLPALINIFAVFAGGVIAGFWGIVASLPIAIILITTYRFFERDINKTVNNMKEKKQEEV